MFERNETDLQGADTLALTIPIFSYVSNSASCIFNFSCIFDCRSYIYTYTFLYIYIYIYIYIYNVPLKDVLEEKTHKVQRSFKMKNTNERRENNQ